MDVYDCQIFMSSCYNGVTIGRTGPEEGIRGVKAWADRARRQLRRIAPKRFAETREILLRRIDEDEERLCGLIAKYIK